MLDRMSRLAVFTFLIAVQSVIYCQVTETDNQESHSYDEQILAYSFPLSLTPKPPSVFDPKMWDPKWWYPKEFKPKPHPKDNSPRPVPAKPHPEHSTRRLEEKVFEPYVYSYSYSYSTSYPPKPPPPPKFDPKAFDPKQWDPKQWDPKQWDPKNAPKTSPNSPTQEPETGERRRIQEESEKDDARSPVSIGLPYFFTYDIDAAVLWPTNGMAYFFKDNLFVEYNPYTNKINPSYALPIDDKTWPGLFKDGIDAAIVWPNGKAYFFKGTEYIQFDIASHKTDAGYPTSIRTYWSQHVYA